MKSVRTAPTVWSGARVRSSHWWRSRVSSGREGKDLREPPASRWMGRGAQADPGYRGGRSNSASGPRCVGSTSCAALSVYRTARRRRTEHPPETPRRHGRSRPHGCLGHGPMLPFRFLTAFGTVYPPFAGEIPRIWQGKRGRQRLNRSRWAGVVPHPPSRHDPAHPSRQKSSPGPAGPGGWRGPNAQRPRGSRPVGQSSR